jgi:aminoglycoside phosphotransferase (APT) family kinase protein
MVDERREPVRVCVIDWELAARGATLCDLAYFTDGADPEISGPIIDAYREAAALYGVPVPDDPAHVMACFRLHRVVDWLSRAVEKGFSPKKTTGLVAQLTHGTVDSG